VDVDIFVLLGGIARRRRSSTSASTASGSLRASASSGASTSTCTRARAPAALRRSILPVCQRRQRQNCNHNRWGNQKPLHVRCPFRSSTGSSANRPAPLHDGAAYLTSESMV